LKGEDYKDVFEQYRVCNIKTTTTKYAAEDLKKYANAMDKVSNNAPETFVCVMFCCH